LKSAAEKATKTTKSVASASKVKEPEAAKSVAKKAAVSKPVAAAPTQAAKPAVPAKKAPAKAAAPVKPVAKAAAKQPVAKVEAPKKASPKAVASAPAAAPVVAAAPAPAKRGRRAVVPPQPTPQPTPSHSPDAAKATFSHFPERVMNFPVHSPARKDPKLANNWKNKPADQLTDEEVLSMSDDDYMNEAQLAFFRHKLVRLKNDILTSAGETTEHLREDTVVVPDPADRATIEEEHALELRTRDRERKLLKKIEQSIARIDSGDYGYCDETGEPIGVGRLIARPTASLSLEAQQRRELKQKMFGD
jgi:DnaK suppressor protein